MGARKNAIEQRWERVGQPWCSHQWARREKVRDVVTGNLLCEICGTVWPLGDPAPPPRGSSAVPREAGIEG